MPFNNPIPLAFDTLAPAPSYLGFIPCPTMLMAGLTHAQQEWQKQVYQLAYAQAQAAIPYRQIESHRELLAEFPSEWRN